MNELLILSLGADLLPRLRASLKADGWRHAGDRPVETWEHANGRILITGIGWYAYDGIKDQWPPVADYDALEPDVHFRYAYEDLDWSDREILDLLVNLRFESLKPSPMPAERIGDKDVRRAELDLLRFRDARLILEPLSETTTERQWDERERMFVERYERMRELSKPANDRILRFFQGLGVIAVAFDAGQWATSLFDASTPVSTISFIVTLSFIIIGIVLVRKWRP
ncbi:hypothetical protein [Bifidobacterium sp. SO1]|uniref:hypothetical protein n=1 Tax=Bifidobacterium sp. SO1 TaxID=2809029 RepID=UPI001BDCF655|nr:hypothetical protein [Bifidobacterium sp. SO1]MBT1161713.1 hypothetical protein [Bifidobacterium sp. SO1]